MRLPLGGQDCTGRCRFSLRIPPARQPGAGWRDFLCLGQFATYREVLRGRGETGRRIGLKSLSAHGETHGAELLKVGETFTGDPEPSPHRGKV